MKTRTSTLLPRKPLKRRLSRKQAIFQRLKKTPKKKEKSISKLVKELDRVFSLYVRLTGYGNKESGIRYCYTCNHPAHYKKMHAGHFVSRFYKATRWDLRNVRVQCPMCNLWKRGDPITFRENLVEELGEEVVRELEQKRATVQKLDRTYLLSEIENYKQKLAEL